jgi:DNA integrity scanning protein DisA with diadenylate cyclase activity
MQDGEFNAAMANAAVQVAKSIDANALFVQIAGVPNPEKFLSSLKKPITVIFLARDEKDEQRALGSKANVINLPHFEMTRMAQIKAATLMAFSQNLLKSGDVFVFLSGASGLGIDTMVTMRVGAENELFQTVGQPKLTEHIKPLVFQRALTVMLEVSHEGREGKPLGALMVIGDYRNVQKFCHQNIINPFRGYAEKERNILDDRMKETIKEFCSIDGAFVLKGTGVIMSAGTIIRTGSTVDDLPQGLGSRHAAAAAITNETKSIALTVSESTGAVRVWRRGQLITEIDKAARTGQSTLKANGN